MDLSQLNTVTASEQGEYLQLIHPVDDTPLTDDNGNPCRLKLLGADSKAYRNKSRELQSKRLSKSARGGKVDVMPTLEERAEIIAAATVGVENVMLNGEPVTVDNIKRVYIDYPWILEQADTFIGERANFLK